MTKGWLARKEQTGGQTDGRTDGLNDGWTEGDMTSESMARPRCDILNKIENKKHTRDSSKNSEVAVTDPSPRNTRMAPMTYLKAKSSLPQQFPAWH